MRKSAVIFGAFLILAGILLLLRQLGIIPFDVGDLCFPAILVALGVWMLWSILSGGQAAESTEAVIPLEGAAQARVHVRHGAGRLQVDGDAGPGELLSGQFGGGLEQTIRRQGDTLDVTLSLPGQGIAFAFPWSWWGVRRGLEWQVGLSREIPLALDLDTGACETHLDLTELQVTDLELDTGASSTAIRLPAQAGQTRVSIRAGAASVRVQVPEGVAARITSRMELGESKIDRRRFPRVHGGHESPDYDTAENRVDIRVEGGVGAVEVF